jgi:hypothetical protein
MLNSFVECAERSYLRKRVLLRSELPYNRLSCEIRPLGVLATRRLEARTTARCHRADQNSLGKENV